MAKDNQISVVKYEGDNETLVWKHPVEDFNMGSQLIVHESQEAIFFRDGQALDLFGAGRYMLETARLPLMDKLYKLPTGGDEVFHSEVYFINMATQMGIKWGTDSKVRLFDPNSGLHIEIGASGEFNIRVIDSRRLLLKVVGTTNRFGQSDLLGGGDNRGAFRALVMTQVKSYIAQTIKENNINILEIDSQLVTLSSALRERINTGLEDYGLIMPEFFVSRIVTPDDDPNFKRMKEQYAEKYLLVQQEKIRKSEAEAAAERKAVEAETVARMRVIGAQGEAEALKIQKEAEAEVYRMQAAAEAEEMRLKGYTYQQETARQVGLEAMQNGIIGGGGAVGGIGELAGLGVGLGAMGSIIGMTKETMSPILDSTGEMGKSVVGAAGADAWTCECGQAGNTTKFCPNCGKPRPQPIAAEGWTCPNCGKQGIKTKFCPDCGARKPESASWDCPNCGRKGIESNFCPNCGHKREE